MAKNVTVRPRPCLRQSRPANSRGEPSPPPPSLSGSSGRGTLPTLFDLSSSNSLATRRVPDRGHRDHVQPADPLRSSRRPSQLSLRARTRARRASPSPLGSRRLSTRSRRPRRNAPPGSPPENASLVSSSFFFILLLRRPTHPQRPTPPKRKAGSTPSLKSATRRLQPTDTSPRTGFTSRGATCPSCSSRTGATRPLARPSSRTSAAARLAACSRSSSRTTTRSTLSRYVGRCLESLSGAPC